MLIRKAMQADISRIAEIYEAIHTQEEQGKTQTGWIRNVYPTAQTAQKALERDDMYVLTEDDRVLGAAIINREQVDVYAGAAWAYDAADTDVLVLHTLVIHPDASGRGYGKAFVAFYEETARKLGCTCLRIDTNARNARARALYQKLGYREADIIPCVFNGIEGVQLVLLEKKL